MKRNKAKARARTRIYDQLYGRQQWTQQRDDCKRRRFPIPKRSNVPGIDETRALSPTWNYEHAFAVWEAFKDAANFSPQQMFMFEDRLAALKKHPPGGTR